MSEQQIPTFDLPSQTVYTQENLYLPEDIACAAKNWPEGEVEQAFAAYRKAIEVNPQFSNAVQQLDKILQKDAPGDRSSKS